MSKVLREQHWWVYIEIMVYVVFIVHIVHMYRELEWIYYM